LATAWNVRLGKLRNVAQAIEIKDNDPFHKAGDYWCHKECYNSNPRKGSKKTARRPHSRNNSNGTTSHVRGCFPTLVGHYSARSSASCGVTARARRKGEDRGPERQFYSQFFGDLREYLNGGFGTSVLPAHQIQGFFDIETVATPKGASQPDFTIHHSGHKVERPQTHIVIINQNRARTNNMDSDTYHNLNTIVIRVTQWEQVAIDDFHEHGAKAFHDAWEQLEGRIAARREEARQNLVSLIERYAGIESQGLEYDEVNALFLEHQPTIEEKKEEEIEILMFYSNRQMRNQNYPSPWDPTTGIESTPLDQIILDYERDKARYDAHREGERQREAEKADAKERQREWEESEKARRKDALNRIEHIRKEWTSYSRTIVLLNCLKRHDDRHQLLTQEERDGLEYLIDFQEESDFILDDWVAGECEWGNSREKGKPNVISRVKKNFSMTETELEALILKCESYIETVDNHREAQIKLERRQEAERIARTEAEEERQRYANLLETGLRETDLELEERLQREARKAAAQIKRDARIKAMQQQDLIAERKAENAQQTDKIEDLKYGLRAELRKASSTLNNLDTEVRMRLTPATEKCDTLILYYERLLQENPGHWADDFEHQEEVVEAIQAIRDIRSDTREILSNWLPERDLIMNNISDCPQNLSYDKDLWNEPSEQARTAILTPIIDRYSLALSECEEIQQQLQETKRRYQNESTTTDTGNERELSWDPMVALASKWQGILATIITIYNGKVSFWNGEYGFITRSGGNDVFFHASDVFPNADIKAGALVKFFVTEGKKGPKAILVTPREMIYFQT
jgi:cold shock CspA family protein